MRHFPFLWRALMAMLVNVAAVYGAHSVEQDGSFSYQIPLNIPRAVMGVQPELSLVYNSRHTNGRVGVGWQLSGLPSIEILKDNDSQGGPDTFMIDGAKLVPIPGSEHFRKEYDDGTYFRPQYIDNGQRSRVEPMSWTMVDRFGNTSEFGINDDSRVAVIGNGKIRAWGLVRLSDPVGNHFMVDWNRDGEFGVIYPKEVIYTYAVDQTLKISRKVVFTYSGRHHYYADLNQNSRVVYRSRLNTMEVWGNGEQLRTYALSYERGRMTGQDRLTRVAEHGRDGVGSPTPRVWSFGWQEGDGNEFLIRDRSESRPNVWLDNAKKFQNLGIYTFVLTNDGKIYRFNEEYQNLHSHYWMRRWMPPSPVAEHAADFYVTGASSTHQDILILRNDGGFTGGWSKNRGLVKKFVFSESADGQNEVLAVLTQGEALWVNVRAKGESAWSEAAWRRVPTESNLGVTDVALGETGLSLRLNDGRVLRHASPAFLATETRGRFRDWLDLGHETDIRQALAGDVVAKRAVPGSVDGVSNVVQHQVANFTTEYRVREGRHGDDFVTRTAQQTLYLYIRRGGEPDKLRTVTEPIGAVHTVHYLMNFHFGQAIPGGGQSCAGGTCSEPDNQPRSLVRSVTTDIGSEQLRLKEYEYINGRRIVDATGDMTELSFAQVVTREKVLIDGTYNPWHSTVIDYSHQVPFMRRPLKIAKYSGAQEEGNLYEVSTFRYVDDAEVLYPVAGTQAIRQILPAEVDVLVYDGPLLMRNERTEYRYDVHGRPVWVRDRARVENPINEAAETVVTETDYLGGWAPGAAWSADKPTFVTVTSSRIVNNVRVTNVRQKESRYKNPTETPAGRPLEMSLTYECDSEDCANGGAWRTDQYDFQFDPFGNVVAYRDRRGFQTVTEYDISGTFLVRSVDAEGNEQRFDYYVDGNPKTMVDANGNRTDFSPYRSYYDAFGRPILKIDPRGGRFQYAYVNEGDPAGQYREITTRELAAVDLSGQAEETSRTTREFFDGAGFVYRVEETGLEPYETSHGSVSWQERTRVKTFEDYYVAANASATALRVNIRREPVFADSGETGLATRHFYDSRRRLRFREDPNGIQNLFIYWGNKVEISSPEGVTTHLYDERGRKFRTNDPLGHDTDFFFDAENRLIGVVTAPYDKGSRLETKITYDNLGRKTSISDPSTGTTRFAYAADGSFRTQTDAAGRVTRFEFDGLGRTVRKYTDYHSASNFEEKITFAFDRYASDAFGGVGAQAGLNPRGQLAEVHQETADGTRRTHRYGYDANGHLTVKEYDFPELGKPYRETMVQRYGGGVLEHNLPHADGEGRQVQRRYDYTALGNIYSVDVNLGDGFRNVALFPEFTAAGRMRKKRLDNGVTTNYVYRGDGRLESLLTRSGGTDLQHLVYSYGDSGLVDGIQDHTPNRGSFDQSRAFGYDGLQRLTSVVGGPAGNPLFSQTYRYDPVGNIIGRDTSDLRPAKQTTPVFTAAHAAGEIPFAKAQKVSESLSMDFDGLHLRAAWDAFRNQRLQARYDAVGNLVGKTETDAAGQTTEWVYRYDASNRLTAVSQNGRLILSMVYDHEGKRVGKTQSTQGLTESTWYLGDDYELRIDPHGGTVKDLSLAGRDASSSYQALETLTAVGNFDPKPGESLSLQAGTSMRLQPGFVASAALGGRLEARLTTPDHVGHRREAIHIALGAHHKLVTYRRNVDGSDSAQVRFYHSDHLGSTSMVTDEAGRRIGVFSYDPFGAVIAHLSDNTNSVNYTFTGQERDLTSGLMNFGARFYDPLWGRFLSADTMVPNPADPRAFHRYAYVLNNPVAYTDPSGHAPVRPTRPVRPGPKPPKVVGRWADRSLDIGSFGDRLFDMFGNTAGGLFKILNIAPAHRHYFNNSGDNIGWTTFGFFSEDPDKMDYENRDQELFDDDLMQDVFDDMMASGNWKKYNGAFLNCQTFHKAARREYLRRGGKIWTVRERTDYYSGKNAKLVRELEKRDQERTRERGLLDKLWDFVRGRGWNRTADPHNEVMTDGAGKILGGI